MNNGAEQIILMAGTPESILGGEQTAAMKGTPESILGGEQTATMKGAGESLLGSEQSIISLQLPTAAVEFIPYATIT